MSRTDTDVLLREHEQAGRHLSTSFGEIFVRDEGDGPPVVLMHGVPVSSLLYRHVLPLLAARGLRGIAFDLLGCGLSSRPADGDYTWTGLGRTAVETVDALGLERFHLVVHDIGGPVGFEVAAAMPERIASLTILDNDHRGGSVPSPMDDGTLCLAGRWAARAGHHACASIPRADATPGRGRRLPRAGCGSRRPPANAAPRGRRPGVSSK